VPVSYKEKNRLLKTVKYREIVRTLTAGCALALAMALMASSASAQTMHPISLMGAGLAGTFAEVTCPNGTDNCAFNTISGTVSKTIGTSTSTGILNATLYSDQGSSSVLRGPNTNDCYATEGKGSISNGAGTNVLKFKIYGLICESSVVGCGAGPLSFAITAGVGIFATATGTGTFNTQSNSCFHSSDAQITMQGLIFK
jgi:hypothetical protein